MRRLAGILIVAAAAGALATTPRAGAEVALDRYEALLQEKRALLRQNAILQQEAGLASARSCYILLHVENPRMEFRVRGKTMKTYSFASLSLDERGRRRADPETVYRTVGGPLTVLEKQGGRPELIPPDLESGTEAGLLYSDPNQLADQTGASQEPVRTDAGVLGVDAPTDYYIKFEEDVVLHVRTPKDLSFRQKAADRLGAIADAMRATLSGWWSGRELGRGRRPKLELFLSADPDTAKNLHFSLLPEQKLLVVPPPPPPILLLASAAQPSPADAVPASR